MKMLSVPQAAEILEKRDGGKYNVSHVRLLCTQGRIKGAVKVGRNWVIPEPVKILPPR